MELKRCTVLHRHSQVSLLIVPCGIETTGFSIYDCTSPLLIVPCGIETVVKRASVFIGFYLLIVPCGIETYIRKRMSGARIQLLIVPCGIETQIHSVKSLQVHTFNRTLWN